MEFSNLESLIDPENTVRLVDAFVDKLDLKALGFSTKPSKQLGRPSFQPKVFLKLYFYGYLNGIRSSRKLERECLRNIEVQWLLGKLQPNYHSIADFRKENPAALRNTFKLFVLFLKNADLLSGTTIAIDGSKFRANNSKKNNYNPKKIERHLKYIAEKTEEYLQEMDRLDQSENQPEKVKDVKEKLERLAHNKINYELIKKQLEESGEPQVSTTDADARALLVQGQVVEISYNMQAAVDEKHKLVVAQHVINRNDRNALSDIALEAKENLQVEFITILSDKGYHNGGELQECKDHNITTICAPPDIVNSNEHGTTEEYLVSNFTYNPSEDTYTCPQGQTLRTTGAWHKKTRERDSYQFKKYRTSACKTCPAKHLCTGRKDGRREIERSQYAQAVAENKERYLANKELYRKRQEWNEHIFGTIKRKWGYIFTDLRGLPKVNGEIALIMTVYNFRRCISIMGVPDFLEKIKNWTPDYKGILRLFEKMAYLKHFRAVYFEIFTWHFSKIAAL
jgi:radical SAM protein with 4Fe4S-binding SPASM domain